MATTPSENVCSFGNKEILYRDFVNLTSRNDRFIVGFHAFTDGISVKGHRLSQPEFELAS